ncbi:nucleotide-sugar transporter-domain-containing protein [Melampsora americana]|nr:nucleotide-sugar transporter-domain-containing protein [Melampsora americana]
MRAKPENYSSAVFSTMHIPKHRFGHRAETIPSRHQHGRTWIALYVCNTCLSRLSSRVQNNLLYVALSNLDTPTFLVTSQLKILSTALFSVLIFKKSLTNLQWTSLVLLTLGVSLVQLQPRSSTKSSHRELNDGQDWLKGLIAIICSCLSSGLAGCYFEKLVKDRESRPITGKEETNVTNTDTPTASPEKDQPRFLQISKSLSNSLWAKNIQLSFCTIPFAFLAIYLDPHAYIEVKTRGFFCGYSALVWSVIVYHALGGILVSIIVKQSSTVTKSFANSLSIVLSALLSSGFSGAIPSGHYLLGTALVIISTRMYSSQPPSRPQSMVTSHKKDN